METIRKGLANCLSTFSMAELPEWLEITLRLDSGTPQQDYSNSNLLYLMWLGSLVVEFQNQGTIEIEVNTTPRDSKVT
jgi:hypothetical protein